jgi:uncharacterized protein (DUF305 family)
MVRSKGTLNGILFLVVGIVTVSGPTAQAQSQGKEGEAFERHFLMTMIPHHQMAVDMAKDCVQKATHEELKTLCRTIASNQEKESGTMRSWLGSWYGGQPAPEPMPGMMKKHQGMMAVVKALTGAQYETRFMNEMSMHHRQALKDSKQCVDRASHAELKEFCTKMTADQQKEIDQMHTWLCDWHKDCHSGHGTR